MELEGCFPLLFGLRVFGSLGFKLLEGSLLLYDGCIHIYLLLGMDAWEIRGGLPA